MKTASGAMSGGVMPRRHQIATYGCPPACETGCDLANRYLIVVRAGVDSLQCRAVGLVVDLGGGDSAPGGLGSGVQASVPNGDDQAGVADGQRAG